MNKRRAILLFLLIPAACLLQGCEAFIAGYVANDTAIQSQEHAAYTDYFFEAEAKNEALQQAGQPPQPILTKKAWLEDFYRPRLAYANYYVDYTKEKSSAAALMPYEDWKEVYKKQLEADRNTRPTSLAPSISH
jgi:hypothetical protein